MQRYLYEYKFRPVNDHAMARYLDQKSKILFAKLDRQDACPVFFYQITFLAQLNLGRLSSLGNWSIYNLDYCGLTKRLHPEFLG
jgi:hypothetical protein